MAREDFVDHLYSKYLNRKKYLENVITYVGRIKEICRFLDPECRIMIFGSYVRNTMRPDSDIDVLLITELAKDPWIRAKLYIKISENIGFEHPFEIHIITKEEYEKWYRNFIDVYMEI